MAFSFWHQGKHDDPSVFELFHRKNPFKGEYTIFAGLQEALAVIATFRFSEEHLAYVRKTLLEQSQADPKLVDGFIEYLSTLDCSKLEIRALSEGSVCFPRVPFLQVIGPLAVCQLLETPLLNLINFASLVATNAARFRLAVGPGKKLLEFGARRAQGPDGALSASRYSYIGGFDGTSHMLAGLKFGIAVSGTMAHSYVTSFAGTDTLRHSTVKTKDGADFNVLEAATTALSQLKLAASNSGEFLSFVSYACSFPNSFLALIDTYNTLLSGLPNFLAVASALITAGYKPRGVRLDSGDLAYLSRQCRLQFNEAAVLFKQPELAECVIVASNDLTEETILSLRQQGHEIDVFGVGTNLVTCQSQPALGGVFKLVETLGIARIKISEDFEKIQIPGAKKAFRLYGSKGSPVVDLLCQDDESEPQIGVPILCMHPFVQSKRCYISPTKVESLLNIVWRGRLLVDLPTDAEIRAHVQSQLANLRTDHLRVLNPTPYKVAVSTALYEYLHRLWMELAPIRVVD